MNVNNFYSSLYHLLEGGKIVCAKSNKQSPFVFRPKLTFWNDSVFMWINNPEASAELCIEWPKPVKGDQGPDFDA